MSGTLFRAGATSDSPARKGGIWFDDHFFRCPEKFRIEIRQTARISEQRTPQGKRDEPHLSRPLVGFQLAVGESQLNRKDSDKNWSSSARKVRFLHGAVEDVQSDHGSDPCRENGVVRPRIQEGVEQVISARPTDPN